jgi:hypothetical protein
VRNLRPKSLTDIDPRVISRRRAAEANYRAVAHSVHGPGIFLNEDRLGLICLGERRCR